MPVPENISMRDPAIDRFRGLAILAMAIVNYLEHIQAVPAWLKHAPDIGLTIADFVAPFFIFAIGLTCGESLRRRMGAEGLAKTARHFFVRAMTLVGIGALFSVGQVQYGFGVGTIPWGTLQAIGCAIALSFPFLFIPPVPRLLAAMVALAGYQWALQAFWISSVVTSSHGGIAGTLSWTCLLIIASVFGDLYAGRRHSRYWVIAAVLLVAGVCLSFYFPISKHQMSCSYDLIVVSVAAILFGVIALTTAHLDTKPAFLRIWGRNPLGLYVIHLFLLAAFLVPQELWWHAEAPLLQAAIQGSLFIAVLHVIAYSLFRKGIFIAL
jgi:predicted acyltransferase